jgi:hypothetical protein
VWSGPDVDDEPVRVEQPYQGGAGRGGVGDLPREVVLVDFSDRDLGRT